MDDAKVDFDSPTAWDEHIRVIEGLLDAPVDVVFTGDEYGVELARRLDPEWGRADPDRVLNTESGTAVRADVEGYWRRLAPSAGAFLAQRVVVLGAESTGSTTLARALADDLGTLWVKECGREDSEIRPGGFTAPWRSDEVDLVVDRQIELEDRALRRTPRPLLICDTAVLARALSDKRYVGEPAPRILERAVAHPPALYILTGDEIPFVQDGLRDREHVRAAMQKRLREVLNGQAVPWVEVIGPIDVRLSAAGKVCSGSWRGLSSEAQGSFHSRCGRPAPNEAPGRRRRRLHAGSGPRARLIEPMHEVPDRWPNYTGAMRCRQTPISFRACSPSRTCSLASEASMQP